MNKVIPIYEAKTQLSKLVKKAQAGETIYIGAYGQPQAIISAAPIKKPIQIGVWAHKKKDIDYELLAKSDVEIAVWLENDK